MVRCGFKIKNSVDNEINILKAEYRLLSEIQDLFPKNSIHKASVFIDKKMEDILNKIEHNQKQV